MKKIFLILAAAVVLSSLAWAQASARIWIRNASLPLRRAS